MSAAAGMLHCDGCATPGYASGMRIFVELPWLNERAQSWQLHVYVRTLRDPVGRLRVSSVEVTSARVAERRRTRLAPAMEARYWSHACT